MNLPYHQVHKVCTFLTISADDDQSRTHNKAESRKISGKQIQSTSSNFYSSHTEVLYTNRGSQCCVLQKTLNSAILSANLLHGKPKRKLLPFQSWNCSQLIPTINKTLDPCRVWSNCSSVANGAIPLVTGAPLLWKGCNTRTTFGVSRIYTRFCCRYHRTLGRRREATCEKNVNVAFWTSWTWDVVSLASRLMIISELSRASEEERNKTSHGSNCRDRIVM